LKFSEIDPETWEELRPYLDTCLLPVTGMIGKESPFEATASLEALRDIMDLVEVPFNGRIVTYPAAHYIGDASSNKQLLEMVCSQLKAYGFKYIILISAKTKLEVPIEQANLWITPNPDGSMPSEQYISQLIRELWNN